VREKFSTYDAFARANLGEIYGSALDDCLTLTCNELRHVVLENRGDSFRLHGLPRAAQISASFGVLVCDVDGDGVPEIVLAHNFWSPEPETGRIDGGLGVLLRHTSALNYEAVPAIESGIMMPFDSRGVMFLDAPLADLKDSHSSDAWLVFAKNNDLYGGVSYPVREKQRMVVRLAGPDGNPSGIGAKVALLQDGGDPIVRERLAGDGYLTQSSPVLWFPKVVAGTLRVQWPDGEVTEHPLSEATSRITLSR
jgi:hypothetical protein